MGSVSLGANKKILIASAHEKSRIVIEIMLHKLGYTSMLAAVNGSQADKIINDHSKINTGLSGLLGNTDPIHECALDLVILDCEFSPGCGTEYLQSLRRKLNPDQAPVLLIAPKTNGDKLKSATDIGANETLLKPFTLDELKMKVLLLLSRKKAPVVSSFEFKKPAVKVEEKKAEAKSGEPEEIEIKAPAAVSNKNNGTAKGRSSVYRSQVAITYSTDGPPTATVKDGKINGHYHEKVDVIGGGMNCFWAKQVDGEERVRLEYLSNKGKPTGIEAKIIGLERFMYTFYLCEEVGCAILERLEE